MKPKSKYWELLCDPRWQQKRLEIMKRDGFTCQNCGSHEHQLQVHHRYYVKGRNPWDYPDEALVTFCKYCHEDPAPCDEASREVESCIGFHRVDFSQLDWWSHCNGMKSYLVLEALICGLESGEITKDQVSRWMERGTLARHEEAA